MDDGVSHDRVSAGAAYTNATGEDPKTPVQWNMSPDHHPAQYANGPPRLINITSHQDGKAVPALVLTFEMVQKMRNAMSAGDELRNHKGDGKALQDILNELHKIKAATKVADLRVESCAEIYKQAGPERTDEVEARLLKAYEDQSKLQERLSRLMQKEQNLRASMDQAHRNFETRWTEFDAELGLAFKDSGFSIESSVPLNLVQPKMHQNIGHSQRPTLNPSLPSTKGYDSNPLYVAREDVQNTLSGLVRAAKSKYMRTRAKLRK